MRRIAIWFAVTVTVVVLLFGYHTSTNSTAAESAPAVSAAVSTAPTTPEPAAPGTDTDDGGAAPPEPTATAEPGTTSEPQATPSATPSASATPSSSASASAGTFTGSVAQTRWGPVQVEITVAGEKVTDVTVPVYPDENPRDQEINSYALPTLVSETQQAQSAQIDVVSGATVTSDGYIESLQSALDQAGL